MTYHHQFQIDDLRSQIETLYEEKNELQSEIDRHHRDFQAIRDLLDLFSPSHKHTEANMKVLIKKIRNVVG